MEYPRTAAEFNLQFSTEEVCWDYLVKLRWPEGFRCPNCGSPRGMPHVEQALSVWRMRIRGVRHRRHHLSGHSEAAQTLVPSDVVGRWAKNGASAVGLNHVLGIGSEKTAWTWLHKLRRAMVRPGREPLTGEVEVDETCVGGVEKGGGTSATRRVWSLPPRFAATGLDVFA